MAEPLVEFDSHGKPKVSASRGASFASASLLLDALVKAAPHAHGTLLDLGCGTKPYAPLFANHVTSHVGLDWPNSPHEQAAVDVFADVRSLPFQGNSFDTVLCTEVLEHCPEPARLVGETFRVLRPQGTLILTTPFLYPVHEAPYDFFRFTRFGLESLVRQAGFELVEMAPIGGFGSVCVNLAAKFVQHGAQIVGRKAGREDSFVRATRGPLVFAQRAYLAAAHATERVPGLAGAASHAAGLYANGHLVVARHP